MGRISRMVAVGAVGYVMAKAISKWKQSRQVKGAVWPLASPSLWKRYSGNTGSSEQASQVRVDAEAECQGCQKPSSRAIKIQQDEPVSSGEPVTSGRAVPSSEQNIPANPEDETKPPITGEE